jgi:AraC-like DNA-binding protein
VMRFARAVRGLERVPRPRWAEIAADCGYYDQAHLHRDFRQFAGVTPAAYFAGRPPNYGVPGY